MTKILTQAQAQEINNAISAMNMVHLRAFKLEFAKAIVDLDRNGTIRVNGPVFADDERYADQDAFAAAYGLSAN